MTEIIMIIIGVAGVGATIVVPIYLYIKSKRGKKDPDNSKKGTDRFPTSSPRISASPIAPTKRRDVVNAPDRGASASRTFASQFTQAANDYIEQYERSKTKQTYVGLDALDGERNKWGQLNTAMNDAISEETEPIFILGEFGSGKTTFCRQFAYDQVREWASHPVKARLPLFLRLHDYKPGMTIYEWMVDYLNDKLSVGLPNASALRRALNGDELLLILDGLDEMAPASGATIASNLGQIEKILGKGSPVILTCRTTFFAEWVRKRFAKYRRFYIAEMNGHQIAQIARKRIGGQYEEFKRIVNDAGGTHLSELAKRPLFLRMMTELYKKGVLRDVENVVGLYSGITNEWIIAETDRMPAHLSVKVRAKFIHELAFRMFQKGKHAINKASLEEAVWSLLGVFDNGDSKLKMSGLIEDVANCTFLDLDSSDNFRFAHHSFMEYFVADKLMQELVAGETTNYGQRVLYEEVYEFITMMAGERQILDALIETLGNGNAPWIARVNAIPPLRKGRNVDAIRPLLTAHIKDKYDLVRYVCGYTLGIFQQMHADKVNTESNLQRLEEAFREEQNGLVRLRMAVLLTESKYLGVEHFEELRPDWDCDETSLEEIVRAPGIVDAYERVLSVDREHEIVIEESIRLLTLYVLQFPDQEGYRESLVSYVNDRGRKHESARIRKIAEWSSHRLDAYASPG